MTVRTAGTNLVPDMFTDVPASQDYSARARSRVRAGGVHSAQATVVVFTVILWNNTLQLDALMPYSHLG